MGVKMSVTVSVCVNKPSIGLASAQISINHLLLGLGVGLTCYSYVKHVKTSEQNFVRVEIQKDLH